MPPTSSLVPPSSQQNLWHRLRWPLVLLILSLLLGLIGSLDIGHALLSNGNSSLTYVSTARPTPGITHTPTQKKPGPTASPGSKQKPTLTATTTPSNTPTPGTIPSAENTPGPTATPSPGPQPSSTTNVLVHDDFVRQDQLFWGVATDGHPWSVSSDANSAANADFSISNHNGVVANADGYYSAVIGSEVSNAMVVVSGTMTGFEAMDSNNYTSLSTVLRWQDNNNWYKAFIDGNTLNIIKHVNGQPTTLASRTFSARPNISYTIRFRAVGSTLQARVWQTSTPEPTSWMLNATDDSFSSGLAGIRLGMQYDIVAYINSFTEFSD